MDYFNYLDFQSRQKADRVRSWYILEQYKDLERNQLDAAQRLRSRCCQEQVALREMSARRERRHCVFEQVESDSDLSVSPEKDYDCYSSQVSSEDEVYSVDDSKYAGRCEDSLDVSDVTVDSVKALEGAALQPSTVDMDMARNINKQLSIVEENFRAIEKCVKDEAVSEYEATTEGASSGAGAGGVPGCPAVARAGGGSACREVAEGALMLWPRLVNFAQQIAKLNHGNCYSDYSTQLSTVVLAFDFVRLGVINMCDILQPYVCPISYTSDDDEKTPVQRKRTPSVVEVKKEHSQPSPIRVNGGSPDAARACRCHRQATDALARSPYARQVVNPMLEVVRCIDVLLQSKSK